MRALLNRYFEEMGAVVEARGGVIAKIIGDAIVAIYDAGDDPSRAARRAARAVLAGREALAALNDGFEASWGVRIENRTGVASGSLAAGEIDQAGTDAEVLAGEVVAAAESLESAAPAGEALVDAATLALLGDAATVEAVGPVARKGGAGTVEAWRLVDAAPVADGAEEPAGPAARASSGVGCAACGAPNEPGVRRCTSCGAVLDGGAASVESRRTVTIVFADPRPLAADGAPLTPDVTHAVMARYFEVMRPILDGHGGTVEKFIGDALMAVFGLPVRHEDDAVRAVRAAADMQAALVELNDEMDARFGVRFANPVGVNTGTVVAGDSAGGQRLVTGDAVNVAARLEQTAAAGEVILGELTRRLAGEAIDVETLEPLTLKGKAEPVPAFRLVRVARAAAGRRHDLPLVGRDDELAALRSAFEHTVRSADARRVTLIGDAGMGKSRVTHEFLAGLGDAARVLHGNCLAYGQGITFWPLLRVVHDAAGIEEGDDAGTARARLAALIPDEPDVVERVGSLAGLVDTAFPVPELVWGLRRLFERLAARRPLVVELDDVHWAEPTLLEVVEQLAGSVRAPVLFLCTARGTVREQHAAFVDDAPVVTLTPLGAEQCARFLELLLGNAAVDAAVVGRIVDAAAGNPLFIEQLLSMLVDDGRLLQVDGRWSVTADLAALEVPASIEAVLTARLDRLPAPERRTIEPASVIGKHFAVDALAHLVDPALRPGVDGGLRDLAGRGLVLPTEDEEPSCRFQHQLIREATYNGLLKQTRAVLHERFVDWAEATNAARDRATEFDEILGYHLEQAHRYWQQLGPLDDHAVGLGVRGSNRLTGAGERALARGDMPAASNLLRRAAALLPEGHVGRQRALLLAGNALHEIGAFDDATAAYGDSAAVAERTGDVAAATAARIEALWLQYLIGRVEDADLVAAEVAAALEQVGDDGDPDALSRIWQLRLNLDIAVCHWAGAQQAADQVITQARRAGNDVLAVRTMPLLAFLAQKGPMPVPQATSACTVILEQVAFDRRSHSLTQLELALLSAMALDVEGARALCADTRTTLGELGWEMQAALVSLSSGPIELLADEPERAEAELRRDYEALQRMQERNFISLTAVLLAEAVDRQLARDADQRPARWIWVYHWPPLGSSTCWTGKKHYGDPDLVDWIDAHHPDVVLTGHVHQPPFKPEGSWVDRVGSTWVFNPGKQIGSIPARVEVDFGYGDACWVSMLGREEVLLSAERAPERSVF